MTRRSIAAIMVGLMIFCLTACGNDSSASSSEEKTPQVQQEQAESTTTEQEEATETVSQESSDPDQEQAPADDSGEYFRDGVFQTDDFRIEITDWRVIESGDEGNEYGDGPIIAFWYTVTNLKTDDTIDPSTPWIMYMSAVQDNDPNMVNNLSVSALPDDAYLDTQMANIKPGGSLANAVGYELTDSTTPVTLTASLFGLTEYGSMTFEIAG